MATPANRVPVRIARGSKANLDTAVAAGDLKEGEICYAVDENGLYVVEGGLLTQAGADLSAASIDALSDVDTTTTPPTDGQLLFWNNANSKWEPGDAGIASNDIQELNNVFDATSVAAVKFTSFETGEQAPGDPRNLVSVTPGTVDNSLGVNAYKVLSTVGYGDGAALYNFFKIDGRYDVVNLRFRSTNTINNNNRISLGGNMQFGFSSSYPGWTLYTRNTGFGFYAGGTNEIGTLPTLNADTWYEATYVLDWGSAQRSSPPNVSIWIDGAIAASNVLITTSYIELTGDEATNFRFFNAGTNSNEGDKYWDDVKVASTDVLPWSMTDTTIINPSGQMDSLTGFNAVNGDVLQWIAAENRWEPRWPLVNPFRVQDLYNNSEVNDPTGDYGTILLWNPFESSWNYSDPSVLYLHAYDFGYDAGSINDPSPYFQFNFYWYPENGVGGSDYRQVVVEGLDSALPQSVIALAWPNYQPPNQDGVFCAKWNPDLYFGTGGHQMDIRQITLEDLSELSSGSYSYPDTVFYSGQKWIAGDMFAASDTVETTNLGVAFTNLIGSPFPYADQTAMEADGWTYIAGAEGADDSSTTFDPGASWTGLDFLGLGVSSANWKVADVGVHFDSNATLELNDFDKPLTHWSFDLLVQYFQEDGQLERAGWKIYNDGTEDWLVVRQEFDAAFEGFIVPCETWFSQNGVIRMVYGDPSSDPSVAINSTSSGIASNGTVIANPTGLTTSLDQAFEFENIAFPGLSIDRFEDVDTSTVAPTDGQLLAWDNTAGKWEPADLQGGAVRTALGIGEYVDDAAAGVGGVASGALYYNTTTSDYRLKS